MASTQGSALSKIHWYIYATELATREKQCINHAIVESITETERDGNMTSTMGFQLTASRSL